MRKSDPFLQKRKRETTTPAIHAHARKVVSFRLRVCCEHCGWPHGELLEVCHIIPIKDFRPDDLVAEINRPDNLALLCPNCHTLLDRGYLSTI